MIRKFFKNKELLKRIGFTFVVLMFFRFGASIAVPGINPAAMVMIGSGSVFSALNLLGGGALEKMSIFAMGVSPYITAGIIIQLLAMDVIPALAELKDNGDKGQKKMEKITRWLALVLCFVQALSITYGLDKQYQILLNPSVWTYLYTASIMTAGSMGLVWLGDQITRKGVGNGLSMIIFAGIAANIPHSFMQSWNILMGNADSAHVFNGILMFVLYCLFYIAIIAGVVIVETAQRRIPVQQASGSTGGNMTYVPFKINSANVIPVIFAQSVISAPQIIISFFNTGMYQKLSRLFSLTSPFGLIVYAVLTFLFTFFYTDLEIDPSKVADNLKKSRSYIPGIRPGTETETYLSKVLMRITFYGATALTLLAVLPYLLTMITPLSGTTGLGGTSIIIVVGVALETVGQIRSRLTERSYKSFFDR